MSDRKTSHGKFLLSERCWTWLKLASKIVATCSATRRFRTVWVTFTASKTTSATPVTHCHLSTKATYEPPRAFMQIIQGGQQVYGKLSRQPPRAFNKRAPKASNSKMNTNQTKLQAPTLNFENNTKYVFISCSLFSLKLNPEIDRNVVKTSVIRALVLNSSSDSTYGRLIFYCENVR